MPPGNQPPATPSTAQAAVLAAAEQLRCLMLAPHLPDLDTLISTALSYGHSNGKVDTKARFLDDLLTRRSHFVHIEITEQTVVLAGDTAVVRHTLHAETLDGGQPGAVALLVLQVWQWADGRWQLLARQAVRCPAPS